MKVSTKLELEIINLDAIVVASLRQSLDNVLAFQTHPLDKKYAKKYERAIKVVLEYYEG